MYKTRLFKETDLKRIVHGSFEGFTVIESKALESRVPVQTIQTIVQETESGKYYSVFWYSPWDKEYKIDEIFPGTIYKDNERYIEVLQAERIEVIQYRYEFIEEDENE